MRTDIAVIGGGIIGSLIAYEARKRGADVILFDPDKTGAAFMASAGILAPEAESANATERRLSAQSFECYPELLSEIDAKTGAHVSHGFCGTFTVAAVGTSQKRPFPDPASRPDSTLLGHLKDNAIQRIGGYVHPRQLTLALREAFGVDGGVCIPKSVVDIDTGDLTVTMTLDDAEKIRASFVVVAAGAWSFRFGIDVMPQRGEALVLEGFSPPGPINVGDGYILPFDGQTYVGATKRNGWNPGVDVDGLKWLLQFLETWFPELTSLPCQKLLWGFRPYADTPIIGRLNKRVFVATGHGKRGVLWAPGTAKEITKLIGMPVA